MTSTTRLCRLAVLCLIVAAFAVTGLFPTPVGAEETYDCSYFLIVATCEEAATYCGWIEPTVQVVGPCDDGNGQLAVLSCGRTGFFCRLTG